MNVTVACLALVSCFAVGVCRAQTAAPEANPADIALFPQQNDIRNALNLSGIWQFRKDSAGVGEAERWFDGLRESRSVAVPGSWNEQFDDTRDYMGLVWYEQTTYVPAAWRGQRIRLRVGSANYAAQVWVNGRLMGRHDGGHLPFAFDITGAVRYDGPNRIAIQVENILKPNRVPTGGEGVQGLMGGSLSNFPKANFDFFPYGGLNRAVWLTATPAESSLTDITVRTTLDQTTGVLNVLLRKDGTARQARLTLTGAGQRYEATVAFSSGSTATATLRVPNARLWSVDDPYLYQLNVALTNGSRTVDRYELPVGIRTVTVDRKQILLNGKPVALKGFGKHEDFPIFGRGTAQPVMVRDFSLLKWVGANSFRTSHYPYDEDYLNLADREGILVIDEIPAVGLFFSDKPEFIAERRAICKRYVNELVSRDKNHPSVILWSLANEPVAPKFDLSNVAGSQTDDVSTAFFTDLHQTAKTLDPTRPTTIVGLMGGPAGWLTIPDVASINRYWGWYTNTGNIAAGAKLLSRELDELYKTVQRPIVITEFGADAQAGIHSEPAEMFTEEYQTEFIRAYLDVAATKDYVAGMHVWAFADFKTSQGVIRFGGMNYKGVFTRDRRPKMAAHFLRSRWLLPAKPAPAARP